MLRHANVSLSLRKTIVLEVVNLHRHVIKQVNVIIPPSLPSKIIMFCGSESQNMETIITIMHDGEYLALSLVKYMNKGKRYLDSPSCIITR